MVTSTDVDPLRAFAPVTDEIVADDLEVVGELPRQLTGLYLRNGPNPRTGSSPHWLFGDGMVHGVQLEAGQARWYRNRYVRTARFEGRPDAGIRGGGTSNTHVFAHAGRIFSFVEAALPVEIDRRLETVGAVDFGGVETAFTAHGKIDPATGELLAFGYQFARPHLLFYRIDRSGRVAERRVVDVAAPCYMHDFAITEHHAVFFDTPARMVRDWGGGGMPFRWQEGQGTRIGVMPREGGEVRWFPVSACQLGHTANAFESDGRIVVDGVRYERFEGGLASGPLTLHRWEIDLVRDVATETSLDHHPIEFPRIDERRTGRPHRYVYTVEFREVGPEGAPSGSLLRRYDIESRTSVAKDFGDRYLPGEGVFVPTSSKATEDDGWVLALRYDRERDRSDLVVLEASDFGGDPVAVVLLPRRVPFGIHGSWVAD